MDIMETDLTDPEVTEAQLLKTWVFSKTTRTQCDKNVGYI